MRKMLFLFKEFMKVCMNFVFKWIFIFLYLEYIVRICRLVFLEIDWGVGSLLGSIFENYFFWVGEVRLCFVIIKVFIDFIRVFLGWMSL